MIQLPSKSEQELVEGFVDDWELSSEAPRLVLTVGGEDFSDRIPSGDVTHGGIAIDIETTFAGDLPLRLWRAPVALDAAIGGARVPMLRGIASLIEPDDDRTSTTLRAASAGAWAERSPLNETVEYSGVRPDHVVRDALRRLPYEQGAVRVQSLESPLLYFARGTEDGPFEADQTVNDVLSKVGEKVPYVYRDTALGGHFAGLSPGLSRAPEVPARMRFRAEELLFWKSPALALEQFARVVVFKNNPDGTPAFEPAVANVTYGGDFPPPPGAIMRVPFTGTDVTEAWRLAYEKALELSRGLYTSEPVLSFDPLLERTDVFTVTETKDEDGDIYEREWLHYVEGYEHAWNLEERGASAANTAEAAGGASESGFQTTPTCSVTLLNEERIKAPALIVPGPSAGVIVAPPAPYGFDDGFWVDAAGQDPVYLYVDGADGWWADEAAPNGRAGFNAADGAWVEADFLFVEDPGLVVDEGSIVG